METLGDKIMQKNCDKFYCKFCDYRTSRKSSYDSHNLSAKHQKCIKGDGLVTLCDKNMQKICNNYKYICDCCNKCYKSRNGLWKHKNKCFDSKKINEYITNNDNSNKELIVLLINENKELKNMMIEQQNLVMKVLENSTHNNYYHNTTNSHNKAFNLNFFLNETCKDAMNIMDFVDSIKLQLSDLEKVGEIGYVEGISKIITTNLKAMDISQRPIHCTDKKREILYVKDEDKWEKEDEDNNKLRKAIKRVTSKNQKLLTKFKEAHPDCSKASSKYSDQYNKIIVESFDNDIKNEDKIIKNISKATIIDKN